MSSQTVKNEVIPVHNVLGPGRRFLLVRYPKVQFSDNVIWKPSSQRNAFLHSFLPEFFNSYLRAVSSEEVGDSINDESPSGDDSLKSVARKSSISSCSMNHVRNLSLIFSYITQLFSGHDFRAGDTLPRVRRTRWMESLLLRKG